MTRQMITNPEDYFNAGCGRCDQFDTPNCSAQKWKDELARLRAICLDAGLIEVAKWGHPVYMHADRNIAILGAFRDNVRITFFNAALLRDPQGVLERQGPNTQTPEVMRFTDEAQITARAEVIARYLAEAKSYAEAGIKAPRSTIERELPEELIEALDVDPELAEAFFALTRGRRNSYVVNLNTAKQSATRVNRIAKFRDKILAGKGAQER